MSKTRYWDLLAPNLETKLLCRQRWLFKLQLLSPFFILKFLKNVNTSKHFDAANISSSYKLLFVDRTGLVPASQIWVMKLNFEVRFNCTHTEKYSEEIYWRQQRNSTPWQTHCRMVEKLEGFILAKRQVITVHRCVIPRLRSKSSHNALRPALAWTSDT